MRGLINCAGHEYRTAVIPSTVVSLLLLFSAFSDNSSNSPLHLAYAQTFGEPIRITDLQGDQTDPHIASSGDNVYLAMTSEAGGTSNIEFT